MKKNLAVDAQDAEVLQHILVPAQVLEDGHFPDKVLAALMVADRRQERRQAEGEGAKSKEGSNLSTTPLARPTTHRLSSLRTTARPLRASVA